MSEIESALKSRFRKLRFFVFALVVIITFALLALNYHAISSWRSASSNEKAVISKIVEGVLDDFYKIVNNEVKLVNFLAQNHSNNLKDFNYLEEILQYGQFIFVNNTGQVFVNFSDFNANNHFRSVSSFIVKNIATEHHLINYHIKVKNNYSEDIGHMIYTIPIGSLISKIEQVFSHIKNTPSFFILDKNYNEVYNSSVGMDIRKNRSCNKIISQFSNAFYLCKPKDSTFQNKLLSILCFSTAAIACVILTIYFLINSMESLALKSYRAALKEHTSQNNYLQSNLGDLDFLSCVTHELRTPLNIIIAFSEIMKNEGLGAINNKEYLKHSKEIYNFGNDLLLTVDSIIDATKYRQSKFTCAKKQVSLSDILDESTVIFVSAACDKNIVIEKKLRKDIQKIFVDQTQVKRAIASIISNIIKLLNKDSRILILAYQDQKDIVTLAIEGVDSCCACTPKKEWENFARNKPSYCKDKANKKFDGIGIGLLLVENILSLNCAKMQVHQDSNHKINITVQLPTTIDPCTNSAIYSC